MTEENEEGAVDQTEDQTDAGAKATEAAAQETEMTEREKGLLEAKQAETKKRQQAEEQLAAIQGSVQAPPPVAQPQAEGDFWQQQGLEDYETPTVAQLRQYERTKRQQSAATRKQQTVSDFFANHPDFAQKVGRYNAAGVFFPSEAMMELVANEPAIRSELSDPLTAPMIAYRAVSSHLLKKELAKQTAANKEAENQQQAEAKTVPTSPAAVGAGGGQAAAQQFDVRNATPEQLAQLQRDVERCLAGEYD